MFQFGGIFISKQMVEGRYTLWDRPGKGRVDCTLLFDFRCPAFDSVSVIELSMVTTATILSREHFG